MTLKRHPNAGCDRKYDENFVRRVWCVYDTIRLLGYTKRGTDLHEATARKLGLAKGTVAYILQTYRRPKY